MRWLHRKEVKALIAWLIQVAFVTWRMSPYLKSAFMGGNEQALNEDLDRINASHVGGAARRAPTGYPDDDDDDRWNDPRAPRSWEDQEYDDSEPPPGARAWR